MEKERMWSDNIRECQSPASIQNFLMLVWLGRQILSSLMLFQDYRVKNCTHIYKCGLRRDTGKKKRRNENWKKEETTHYIKWNLGFAELLKLD